MRGVCSAKRGTSNWEANVSRDLDKSQTASRGSDAGHVSPGLVARVRGRSVSLILALVSALLVTPADAGPCSQEVAAYEQAMSELPGTTGHQSVRAQLHRQPTPESLTRSRSRAAEDEREDRAALERARAADARGDRATCLKALSEAQRP